MKGTSMNCRYPAIVGILASQTLLAAALPVTTESLLTEMTDLKRLAEFSDPAYTCKQFSSYNRASTSPEDAKTWFANADAGQFLRMEEKSGRTEFVMAD